MKKIAGIIALIATVLMLASCSSGKVVYEQQTNKLPVTGRSWTVLVYMCGGNEETSSGVYSDKLEQMMSVEYPENINVVVQTGGSIDWQMKGIYGDYIQRFEIENGTMYLADQSMTANMCDYRVLTDFLMWGTSNYKSDNYMLILSGIGSGSIYGMACDELHENDNLTLEEISYAMSLSGKKFDMVGLDASLMGSIETASALSTCADYLVASQGLQNMDNWDYKGMLSYMCANPSAGADEIGKIICDTYYARSDKNGTAADAAMSVVDMSKISTLSQAFDGMVGNMLMATDSLADYARLSKMMDSVHMYGGGTADEGFSNSIDLGDIALRTRDVTGNTADALINALNDAVLYRVCGEREKSSTGMSVYYPLHNNNDELQEYMKIAISNKYKEFLRKICIDCSVTDEADTDDYTSSGAWATYNEDMQTLEYQSILDGSSYGLNIAGNMDMFDNVAINVYKADKKATGGYVFVGKYEDIENNWEAGIFRDSFNGKMIRLMDKGVTVSLVRKYDDYDIYSVPVLISGERSNIRIKYDRLNDEYEIIGAWSGLDERGRVSGAMRKVGLFTRLTPVLAVYDSEHKLTEHTTGSSGMKLFGGVGKKTVDDGEYIFEYEMTDIYGMKRHGTPVNGRVSGGRINFK